MTKSKGAKMAELAPKIMSAFHGLGKTHPSGKGLSMRQFQALILVYSSESLSLSEICTRLNIAPSTGTELINRMIDSGFFKKDEGADRRKSVVTVTELGLQVMQLRQKAMTEMFDGFLENFPENDQEEFIHAFERIWQIILKNKT